MLPHIWNRWFRKNSQPKTIENDKQNNTQKRQMGLEALEDRTVPATVNYDLGAWLEWQVPNSNPASTLGYGFQRGALTITLEAGETVTISSQLDTVNTYKGNATPNTGIEITPGGNANGAAIAAANSTANFQLYRITLSTTSANGINGTGVIGKWDGPGDNFAGFGWTGLGTQNASGYVRSRGFGLPSGTFDGQAAPFTHFGYLYADSIVVNNPGGTGNLIFEGFELQTGASGGFTRVSTSSALAGGGPWAAIGAMSFNVTPAQSINVQGPVVLGAGVFPGGVQFSTNTFDNTAGGGQKVDFTSNPAGINSAVINIGTNGEKIYSTKALSLSSNGRVMDIDNPTGTSTYNLTSNELINVLATGAGGLNLSTGGATMNWGSTTGDTINLLSAQFGNLLTISNTGNVLFNNTVRFPNNMTFVVMPGASSDVISNNPNDIDFIIEGGTTQLGPFSNNPPSNRQLRNFGTSTNPISTSIQNLGNSQPFGDLFLFNKNNPAPGGQSGTLNVTGAVDMTGTLNINVGPNTLNINTATFRTTGVVIVTSNVLNIAGNELRGDSGVEVQPFDPNMTFFLGRATNVPGSFNLSLTDITTRIISNAYLKVGQPELLGSFIVSNGDAPGGVLNLVARGYSLSFSGKTSSINLNSGIRIANNRRYSIDIGTGDVVGQTGNPGFDFDVDGTNGVIDFTSARNVGSAADPLDVRVARLDRSTLTGNLDLKATQATGNSTLEILGQVNAGLNAVRIQTVNANSNILRTNAKTESDIVGGTIELVAGTTGTNLIGNSVSPIRITGDLVAAKSGGDIYLAAVTTNGANGDTIDIANSGTLLATGGLTAGTAGKVQISGSTTAGASRSTFRLSASELINRTGTVRGSLDIAANTALDMGRFSETLQVLTGVGFITSDPIQGQAGKLTIDNNIGESCIYAGIISGDVQIVKTSSFVLAPQGAGTLDLKGANTYTGGTIVESGQLTLSNNTAIGTGKITLGRSVGAASNVVMSMSNNITISNPIDIANQLVTIRNEAGSNTINSPITFGFTTIVDVLAPGGIPTTLNLAGALSGNQQVFKTSPGNLILSADNNFSGGLQVQAGTLEAQANKALGTGLTDFFSGAAFNLRDPNPGDTNPLNVEIPGGIKLRGTNTVTSLTSATITGNGGQIVLSGTSADTATFSVTNATDTLSLLGGTTTVLIEDNNQNVDVLKNGAGLLRLTGINNFDDLTVSNGTVIGVSNQAFGRDVVTVNGSIVGGNQVYGTVAFDPGLGNTITVPNTFILLGPGNSQRSAAMEGLTGTTKIQGNVSINPIAGVTTIPLSVSGGAVVEFLGSMSDGGNNLTLQKKGTGRLVFNQANTYGGGTQLDAGEIEVKAQGALGTGTVITNLGTSLIFNLPTGATSTFTNPLLIRGAGLDGSSGVIQVTSGTVQITTGEIKLLGNSTIGVNPVNASLELTGKITDQAIPANQPGGPNAGGPYSLTKIGTGKLTLNGGGLTTYRGGTNIQGGQVEVVNQNAMGTGLVSITDGASLLISGANIILPNDFLLAGKGGTGNPGVIQVTTGGTNATINGGIALNSDVAFGVVAGSKLILTNQIDEASGQPGPYGVEKKGQGVLRLEGSTPNLYGGSTLITEGEVQVVKNSALGLGSAVISSGATLATDSNVTLSNPITASGSGLGGQGAIYARSGLSTLSGALTLAGDTTLNGEIDTRIELSGKISESTASKLIKNGLGTYRLSGSGNTYTGPTQVNAGILEAASNQAVGSGAVQVANLATLSTVGNITLGNAVTAQGVGATVGLKTIGALRSESGAGTLTGAITMAANTTVSAATGASLDLQGVVGGNFSLIKGDAGKVVLSGASANTYTQGTEVREGMLVVAKPGALGDTTINAPATVFNNATLAVNAGSGKIEIANPLRLQGVGSDAKGALQALSGTAQFNSQAVVTLDGDTTLGASSGAILGMAGAIGDDADPTNRNLVKVGAGTVRLETTNTYLGTTTVNEGVLVGAASDAFGSNNKLVTVAGGSTLAIEGKGAISITNPIVMGGAGVAGEGAALRVGVPGTTTTAALSGNVGLSSNTVIKVDNLSAATLSGVVSKDASAKTTVILEKAGTGTLTLSNANTYDGGTKVQEGKLVLNNNTAASNQPIFVASGATLGLGSVNLANEVFLGVDATLQSEENATANLVNPGKVNAAGNFGMSTLTGSKLTLASQITDGAASGKMLKSGPGELLFQNTAANEIDGGVDVVGGLFSLDTVNTTFGGNLLVDGAKDPATVQLLQSNQIPNSSKVTLATGVLNLNANSDSVGGVKMGGASQIQGTGTLTSATDFLFSQGQADANLAGTVGLIKDTAALVLLKGINTFSGDVSLGDGTLQLQGKQALNDSTSVIFGSNTATLQVDENETIGNLSSSFAGSVVSLPNANTTLTTGLASNSTYAGQLIDNGDGSLVKVGTGELVLTGANKLSTLLQVSAGTLTIASGDSMGVQNTGPLVIVDAGATLNFNLPGTSKFDNPIDLAGSLRGSQGTSNLVGQITLFNNLNSIDVASGAQVIIDNAVPDVGVMSVVLNKTGQGTLAFSGSITLSNGATGALNVQAGTVLVTADNAVDAGNAPIVVSSGATLFADATSTPAGLKLDNPLTLNGAGVTGAGALAAKGGTTILGSATSSLTINTDSTLFVATGSTLQIDEPIAGAGNITITGGGKVVFNGNSPGYNGNITVSNGEMVVKDPSALGTGIITVENTGKLTIDGDMTLANKFVLAGGLNGTDGSNVIFTGPITLTGTGTFSIGAGGDLDFQGAISESGGSFGITSSGAGDVILSGANTFTGPVTVSGPGKLILNNAAAISASNPVTVSAGTLQLNVDSTIGSLTGSGTIDLNGQTLTLGALNTSTNFAGDIVGAGNLVKNGTGTLTLSGATANTFTGTTTVNAGGLLLNKTGVAAISGSSLEVKTGAVVTLGGSDQIADTTDLVVNGGQFQLAAFNDSVNTVTLKADGTIGGTGTLTSANGPFELESGTITASLGGNQGFNKTTTGTINLGGNNSALSGAAFLNNGLVVLTTTTALNASIPVFTAVDGTLELGASNTIGALDGPGTVKLGANTLTTGAFGDSTFNGTLTGAAGSKLVKAGTSAFDLGANGVNFLGSVDVNAGTLRINATNSLGGANAVLVGASGAFEISVDLTIGSLAGSGTAQLNGQALNTGTLGSTEFSGAILGNAGSKLVKLGSSTFTLSGTVANTVASADVQAGTLLLNKTAGTDAIGSGTTSVQAGATLSLAAANQINNGATLSVNGGTFATNSNNETVNLFQLLGGQASGGGVVTSTQTFDLQSGFVSVILAGTNGLAKSTSGMVNLTLANPDLAGTATLSGGDLVLSVTGALNANTPVTFTAAANLIANAPMTLGALTSAGGVGSIQMATNALIVSSASDTSFSGVISGTSTLTKEGTGAQTLTGINTFTGSTTVNAGTLILASTAAGTTVKGSVIVNTGGTVQTNTGSALDATIPVTVNAGGAFDIRNSITIGSLAGAGTARLNNHTLTTGALGDTTFSGDIQGNPTSQLIKVGASKFTLSGTVANTFANADVQGGTLELNKSAGTDAIGSGIVVVQNGAILSLLASDQIANGAGLSVQGGVFATNGNNEGLLAVELTDNGQLNGGGILTSVNSFALESGTVNVVLSSANGILKDTPGVVSVNLANPSLSGPVVLSGGDLIFNTTGGLNASTPVAFTNVANLILNAPMTIGALSSLPGTGSVQMGSNALTIVSATDTTFAGVISGSSSLTKDGPGTQTFTGVNTYAGPTTIDGGRLILASTGVGTTVPGPITVNTSGVLQVNTVSALDQTIALDVKSGGLFELQTNSVIGSLKGDGGVILNQFTLTTGALESTSFSGTIDGTADSRLVKVGGSTFTLDGPAENTFANADVLAGNLVLNKTAGTNAIGGGTTTVVTTATLTLNASNQIANGATVSINGGNFNTNGNNETVNLVQLLAGQISGGGVVTSTQAFDLQTGQVNAILAGTNGLAKTSNGIVTLNLANPNLSGTAIMGGGDLILAVTGALNANTPVTFTAAANLISNAPMTLGALSSTGGNGTVQMGAHALTISSATDTTFSGVISGTSTLTKDGTGAQTLTGINTYTGPTTVNAGNLVLASTAAGTTIDGDIQVNGGALVTGTSTALDATNNVNLATAGSFLLNANTTIGSLAGSGTTQFNANSLTTGSFGSTTFSGTLLGAAGSKLVKVGSSTFSLTGTDANTVVNTDIQAGTLVLNKTTGVNALGAGTTNVLSGAILSLLASNQIADGATVSIQGGEFATNGNNETINLLQLVSGSITGGGIITSTQTIDLQSGTVNAVLAGPNGLAKSTTGTVILNQSSPALQGPITVSGGDLILNALNALGSGNPISFTAAATITSNTALTSGTLSSAGNVGTIAMGSNNLVIDASIPGNFGGTITGSGTVRKQGAGTQTFSGANTYTGLTTVAGGILALAGPSTNTTIVGNVTIDSGSLRLDASDQMANDRILTLNGGVLALAGQGAPTSETVRVLNLLGGAVTGGLASILNVTEKIDVAISNTNLDATLTGPASFNLIGPVNYTVLRPFQTTGPVNVLNGTLTLSSPTTPSIGSALNITGPGSVVATLNNQIADTQIVTINGDGLYDIGSTNDTVGGLSLVRGTVTGTSGVLSSASNFAVQGGTVSAILGGSNGLVKTDAGGTVALTRVNTFTGPVQVQGGILELAANGRALASNSITVNGGILRVGSTAVGAQMANTATATVSAGTLNLGTIDQTLAVINMTGGEITGSTGRLFTSQPNFVLANGRVSAILAGATTGLVASGTGTLVLANTNQYGGLTTVAGGNLTADANSNAIPGNVLVTGGVLRLNRSNQIVDTATVNMNGGTIDLASNAVTETIGTLLMDNGLIGPNTGTPRGTLNASGFDLRAGRVNAVLGGSGQLLKTTGGTLTLSATNTFTGGSDIKGGVVNLNATQGGSLPGTTAIASATVNLQAANQVPGQITLNTDGILNVASFANSAQSLTINGGRINGTSGVFSATSASGVAITTGVIDAILGGAFGLNKNGVGSASLNKPGQYNGATNINGGILQLTGTGGVPDGSLVTVANGARLDLNGLTDQFNGLQGQGTVNLGASGLNSLILGVTNPSATNDFKGIIEGTGTFVKSGSGNQTLSGPNTFTGNVQVQGGTLGLAGTSASVLPDSSPVVVSLGATLAVNKNETIGALTGQGTANLGSGFELVSSYGSDTQVQIGLSGNGSFRKNGAGNVNLTSSSANFAGTVLLAQGGLSVRGVLGGTTQVLGGNLTGTGSASTVQVNGGTYSPGTSPGTFTVGTFTGSSSGTYLQEINGITPGSQYDQTIITQAVNVTGLKLSTVIGSGFSPTAGQSFTIVDNQGTGSVVGTFAGLPEGAIFTVGSTRLQITYRGGSGNNDIVLSVPQASTAVGMVLGSPGGTGGQSVVTVYNTAGAITRSFVPFPGYAGSLRTAVGDVTGDGVPDISVVTGVGAVPAVKVFNGANNSVIYSFLAFDQGFAGGLSVAMGDINADGRSDIMVGTLTASSHIKIYSGANLTLLKSFITFGAGYTGGVNLAAGDYTGDGRADVIVGAGVNSSRVVVLNVAGAGTGTFTQLASFFAFASNLPGGVFVASADLNGDGRAEILTGSGSGTSTPQMRVFNGGNAALLRTINMNTNYLGGVRVTIGDTNNDGLLDLLGGAGPGYQPVVSAFSSTNGGFLRSFLVYASNFRGGVVF